LARVAIVSGALAISANGIAQDKVVFGLDWVVSGQHAPFFVAQEKGFYTRAGLEVDIQRGYGSAEAVKRVGAGNVMIGFGDTGALVLARADGIRVKTIAIVYGKPPYSLLVRKDANISHPRDLQGKVLAAPAGGAARAMFPILAELTGIEAAKVHWLTTDAANLLPLLMANRVSGVATFYVQRVSDESRAKAGGIELTSLKYADYGLKMYGNGLIATDELLKAKPDLVKRFVAATVEGFHYAFANPKEAGDLLAKRHSHLDSALVAGDVRTVRELSDTPESRENGFGFMSTEVMLATRDIVAKVFNAPAAAKLPVAEAFTNDFLPRRR
jgi:NitT/TauT family transport system substrate-binding protein